MQCKYRSYDERKHQTGENVTGIMNVSKSCNFLNEELSADYVLDCFVKADKTNKYGKYAAALKKAVTNYSRMFVSDGEEMIVFHLFNKEAATIIKLFSIYIAAVQEMPEQYFDQIVEVIMNRSDENE